MRNYYKNFKFKAGDVIEIEGWIRQVLDRFWNPQTGLEVYLLSNYLSLTVASSHKTYMITGDNGSGSWNGYWMPIERTQVLSHNPIGTRLLCGWLKIFKCSKDKNITKFRVKKYVALFMQRNNLGYQEMKFSQAKIRQALRIGASKVDWLRTTRRKNAR